VSHLPEPRILPVERQRIPTITERDLLPLLPAREPKLATVPRKAEVRSARRKRPVKGNPTKGGKKKKKDQRRRGRSQRQDDEGKQPELDIKVTQHTE
jgi:hypothetical protein